jgi:hypothetical protein
LAPPPPPPLSRLHPPLHLVAAPPAPLIRLRRGPIPGQSSRSLHTGEVDWRVPVWGTSSSTSTSSPYLSFPLQRRWSSSSAQTLGAGSHPLQSEEVCLSESFGASTTSTVSTERGSSSEGGEWESRRTRRRCSAASAPFQVQWGISRSVGGESPLSSDGSTSSHPPSLL